MGPPPPQQPPHHHPGPPAPPPQHHQAPHHPSGPPAPSQGGAIMPVHGEHSRTMAPPPGHGAILLTLQGNALTTGLTPAVHLDGHRVSGAFGPTLYPLRPGRHRVDVHTQWLRRYGQAGMEVDVREGQVVPVSYAVPWHQFTTGSIGHETQKRKGVGVLVAMLAVVVLVVALCVGGPILLS